MCFDLMKSVITYSTSQAVKLQKKISKKALQAGYLQNFTKLCLGNVNEPTMFLNFWCVLNRNGIFMPSPKMNLEHWIKNAQSAILF